jgi:hypothetical protein
MRRERETLESRMRGNVQVRFGGGTMEKGPQGTLASFLPYPMFGVARRNPLRRKGRIFR